MELAAHKTPVIASVKSALSRISSFYALVVPIVVVGFTIVILGARDLAYESLLVTANPFAEFVDIFRDSPLVL